VQPVVLCNNVVTDDVHGLQREIGNLRRLCSERGCTEEEIAHCKPRRRSKFVIVVIVVFISVK